MGGGSRSGRWNGGDDDDDIIMNPGVEMTEQTTFTL